MSANHSGLQRAAASGGRARGAVIHEGGEAPERRFLWSQPAVTHTPRHAHVRAQRTTYTHTHTHTHTLCGPRKRVED